MTGSITTQPTNLRVAMEQLQDKIIEEGSLAGKKVKPSKDLCEKFEIFQNMLSEAREGADKAEISKGIQMLSNVRSQFRIKEKDATAGKITRAFFWVWGRITGTRYVYIKGGPVDLGALKKRVDITALPIIGPKPNRVNEMLQPSFVPVEEGLKRTKFVAPWVSDAEHEKLYTLAQSEGRFYLQGPDPETKMPVTVTEKGLSLRLGSENVTCGSMKELRDELKSRGYLEASALTQEVAQFNSALREMQSFSSQDEASQELGKHSDVLHDNQGICGVVIQNELPISIIYIIRNSEGKISESTRPINHETMRQLQKYIGKDNLLDVKKIAKDLDLDVNKIYENNDDFVKLAGLGVEQYFNGHMLSKEEIDEQITRIGPENAQNVCTVVWNEDLKGGKIIQWTGEKPDKKEIAINLAQKPGQLTVAGKQYPDIKALMAAEGITQPILMPEELKERAAKYPEFVDEIKKEIATQSTWDWLVGGAKDLLSYTGIGPEPKLYAKLEGEAQQKEIKFVYQNKAWKVSIGGRTAASLSDFKTKA